MLAKKCDRCKEFYENYTDGFNSIRTGETFFDFSFKSATTYDLCPNCKAELEKWLNYSEPGTEPEPVDPPPYAKNK